MLLTVLLFGDSVDFSGAARAGQIPEALGFADRIVWYAAAGKEPQIEPKGAIAEEIGHRRSDCNYCQEELHFHFAALQWYVCTCKPCAYFFTMRRPFRPQT